MVYEELPLSTKKLIPSDIQVSIFELKLLPKDLKYAFLEPKETFRMVFLVHLNENQQEHLLLILRKYNGVLGWNTQTSKVWMLLFGYIVSLWKMELRQ